MSVVGSVVANADGPPEVVDTAGAAEDVGVPGLVVVADPGSNESPEGLDIWVSTESGSLLWLSSYSEVIRVY